MSSSEEIPLTTKALNGEERKRCWAARDAFLGCLEEHQKESIYRKGGRVNFRSPPACAQFRQKALEDCPLSWLTHFEMKWGRETLQKVSLDEFPDVKEE